ncbi:hypothetical protein BN000_04908 [Neobacillus massiliamazoniensis]|uniref:Alpha/beta hydrolase n=1 Tax=Neobacillus massiliamazoniensis TaxID=1499688 RepID=A0A0U1P3K3_9BACI|nr:hypothetical protein BN000_04908 [Neobacillus massiliamazoniensis]
MPQIELSSGVIENEDTGGEGPVVVLMGGLVIGPSLWREVVADLRKDFAALFLHCLWVLTRYLYGAILRCLLTP